MTNPLDGWKSVWCYGEIMWEFWDEGVFILRCSRVGRDQILNKANLPLKIIADDVEGLLTSL